LKKEEVRMEKKKILLSEMEIGQAGVVIEFHGGQGMLSRLSTLGIRIGEKVKKISQQALGGPVVIEIGKSQVAIGFGMASRILVEIEKEEKTNENSSNG